MILVSEKDAVKLKDIKFSLPFYKVVIDLEILEGREIFNKSHMSVTFIFSSGMPSSSNRSESN